MVTLSTNPVCIETSLTNKIAQPPVRIPNEENTSNKEEGNQTSVLGYIGTLSKESDKNPATYRELPASYRLMEEIPSQVR